jgi:hypothetical protein
MSAGLADESVGPTGSTQVIELIGRIPQAFLEAGLPDPYDPFHFHRLRSSQASRPSTGS